MSPLDTTRRGKAGGVPINETIPFRPNGTAGKRLQAVSESATRGLALGSLATKRFRVAEKPLQILNGFE